jgi:RecG-like helicase
VNGFEFTDSHSWAGRPVVRCIADAQERSRIVVTGTVVSARTVALGATTAYECVIEDGTGALTLVFVGRNSVPGVMSGAVCTVEGTIRLDRGHLAVWNPFYELGSHSGNTAR